MIKRALDILISIIAVMATFPLWVVAAAGIKLKSAGPVFYRAQRAGLNNKPFTMYKFRTMHWQPEGTGPAITGKQDHRVFRFGSFLRKTKIDELPQFLNVLKGDLSIVGPRPEDPGIVNRYYTDWMLETLSIKPGITSPGALWGYTKMEDMLTGNDPEADYVEKVLPYKLALEYVYTKNHNLLYDLKLIYRTASIILRIITGQKEFSNQPEDKMIPADLFGRVKG